jgi:hypothetical protein
LGLGIRQRAYGILDGFDGSDEPNVTRPAERGRHAIVHHGRIINEQNTDHSEGNRTARSA